MPATAGRVRMPANNRVHSSAALQTHGIWQSAIGYDPYAPNKDEKKNKSSQKSTAPEPENEPENAYASFQGLLALARITGSNADEARGACKKCGRVGHLTFQCRNFLSAKDEADREGKDPESIQAVVLSGLEKLKGERVKAKGKNVVESDESSEEVESYSSDSEYDSEIERAIAAKFGKRDSGGNWRSDKKSKKRNDSNDSDNDGDRRERRKKERRERGRSKKRSSAKRVNSDSSDEDEGTKKRSRKDKRRKRDYDSMDEEEERRRRRRKSRKEKRRRRSHRYSDDDSSDDSVEQRHKRRSRRAYSVSDSDVSGSDDSRVGRDKKRSEKKRNHRHEED